MLHEAAVVNKRYSSIRLIGKQLCLVFRWILSTYGLIHAGRLDDIIFAGQIFFCGLCYVLSDGGVVEMHPQLSRSVTTAIRPVTLKKWFRKKLRISTRYFLANMQSENPNVAGMFCCVSVFCSYCDESCVVYSLT
jgi:hypothetical protein